MDPEEIAYEVHEEMVPEAKALGRAMEQLPRHMRSKASKVIELKELLEHRVFPLLAQAVSEDKGIASEHLNANNLTTDLQQREARLGLSQSSGSAAVVGPGLAQVEQSLHDAARPIKQSAEGMRRIEDALGAIVSGLEAQLGYLYPPATDLDTGKMVTNRVVNGLEGFQA